MNVRFAPSPTGYLHIGGARTALFNWMYAKAQKGQFILRIEDTDLERSKKEYLDEILESLQWLGLRWDACFLQSERFDLYRRYAKKLLEEGKAYQEGQAVILRIPPRDIKLYDLIRGEIHFEAEAIKDQVLMKSDGSPTYSFACVIDDALMEITHVIRGEDHISNTPKQIAIYEALGFSIPKFAHLPLILDAEGGRMSKRTGAVAVSEYRTLGFVPEGIINYLMLLGWSPGPNQEIVALDKAVQNFSIKKINKAAAVFSMDKLKWVNGQQIKAMPLERLTDYLIPLLKENHFIHDDFDRPALEKAVSLFKGRLLTLHDFLDWADFVFLDHVSIKPQDRDRYFLKDRKKEFWELAKDLEQLNLFTPETTEAVFRDIVARFHLNAADLVHPVRVALTGKSVGPGLFETMSLLGKTKTVKRLQETFLS